MQEGDQDNLQTWPRAQLPAKVRMEMSQWIQRENDLQQAKAYLASQKPEGKSEFGSLIERMCQLIEQANQAAATKALMGNIDGSQTREKRPSMSMMSNSGTAAGIRRKQQQQQQQQMQSMILCKPLTTAPSSRRNSDAAEAKRQRKLRPTPALLQGMPHKEEEEEQKRQIGGITEEGQEMAGAKPIIDEVAALPWALRVLPNVSIVLSALFYLIAGAAILRFLDPELAKKPFRWAVILTFETCATIGWGDSKPMNRWSQAFCTVYTIFGVPILFSAFANIGRLISPFYTVDWLFLTGVVRKKMHGSQHRLPIKRALNFIILHQFLGALLYSGLLKDMPVVTAIYFSVTSMGTVGIGDYHPDTRNDAEAVVALLYIGIGIVLLSALMLSINYYFQALIFLWFRDKLHSIWEWSGKGKTNKVSSTAAVAAGGNGQWLANGQIGKGGNGFA